MSDEATHAKVAVRPLADLSALGFASAGIFTSAPDARLARAAELLAEHRASHLVVRDQRRAPIGILSTLDIARALGTRSGL